MVKPDKSYSTRESDYTPGETTKRAYSKTSVLTVLREYEDAVVATCARSYNPSAKLGPQGQRKASEYPKVDGVTASMIADEIEDWGGDIRAYVTPIREEKRTQKVIVKLVSGYSSTYTYEFVVDARKVAWV